MTRWTTIGAVLAIVACWCSATPGAELPQARRAAAILSDWYQGIAVTDADDPDMKMYLWFYEWNMFGAVRNGQHTSGIHEHPRRVSRDCTSAEITSRDMRLVVKATSDGALLWLFVTNRSDHDWPELAAVIPCWSPGPDRTRNLQFNNENTYFLGPDGLIPLIARQIHFAEALRAPLERLSGNREFVFSSKWPTSETDARRGILIRESTDRTWVTGIVWDDFLSVQGHNPWQCMHVSVRVGPLRRGATTVVRGRAFLFKGGRQECLSRCLRSFPRLPDGPPDRTQEHSQQHPVTVRKIERLGGSVFTARATTGEPVTYAGFSGEWRGGAAGLSHFENLINLEVLWLYGGQVTDEYLAQLGRFSGLKRLDLVRTRITGAGLAHLVKLPALTRLGLRESSVGDRELGQVRRLTQLSYLDLSRTHVTDAGMPALAELVHLRGLVLNDTRVTDAGLARLRGLTELGRLGLEGTRITDGGLDHLADMKKLNNLWVGETRVTRHGIGNLQRKLPALDQALQ